ncbi:unnamed protein product [Boreogadus saida]
MMQQAMIFLFSHLSSSSSPLFSFVLPLLSPSSLACVPQSWGRRCQERRRRHHGLFTGCLELRTTAGGTGGQADRRLSVQTAGRQADTSGLNPQQSVRGGERPRYKRKP